MTWDDVRALHRAAMDVESHSHTHRVLQTLDRAQLETELHISRALLDRAIGRTPVAMSYPVGRAATCSDEIRSALHGAGYRLGFSNRAGVIPRDRFDAHDIHRMSVEGETAWAFFESVLAFPALAY
jgi:peptidoglycan/xylan/chitin deacetylase (PgdA/CDA1 family)